MAGGRTLWNLGRKAANCRHWLLSPHALTCVWHSRCPLTCPLLGPLLPLSCCCLGRSLLSHLEQLEHWQLEETVRSGPRARARALWVAQSSFYIERKWRLDVPLWIEIAAFAATSALRSPVVKTKDPSYHNAFLISRQESVKEEWSSCARPTPLPPL